MRLSTLAPVILCNVTIHNLQLEGVIRQSTGTAALNAAEHCRQILPHVCDCVMQKQQSLSRLARYTRLLRWGAASAFR